MAAPTHCPGDCQGLGLFNVTHTYFNSGDYTVTLTTTWTDENQVDHVDVDTAVVEILPTTGEVVVFSGGPYDGFVNRPIQVIGAANWTGQQAPVTFTATWIWGDGNQDSGQNLFAIAHTYTQPAIYTIFLVVQVRDEQGTMLDEGAAQTTIAVQEVNPQILTAGRGTVATGGATHPLSRIFRGGPM